VTFEFSFKTFFLTSFFFIFFFFLFLPYLSQQTMTFLTAIHRMAPAAIKQAATASVKPTAVAFTQKRFNSTGSEVYEKKK
jgi:hypothetical protein